MAGQITVPILRDPVYRYGDKIEVEVEGTPQSNRMRMWGGDRQAMGFGFGPFGEGLIGLADSGPGFGYGPLGLGDFGVGLSVAYFKTTANYIAGDYTVRARAYDPLSNVGDWSAMATLPHRPAPAPPKSLSIDPQAGTFCWLWDELDDG